LRTFELRNTGLPVITVKEFDGTAKSFVTETAELKDLKVHPDNPDILVTATYSAVYLSVDGGQSWNSMGLSAQTAGVKSVAVATLPDAKTAAERLTVFMSHPIYGLSYCYADSAGKRVGGWVDILDGFELMETSNYTDELADVIAVSSEGKTELYLSQTFRPRVYRLDWAGKKGELLWTGEEPTDTIDSLAFTGKGILFISPDGFGELIPSPEESELPYTRSALLPQGTSWERQIRQVSQANGYAACAWISPQNTGGRGALALSEFWLLDPETIRSPYADRIGGRDGLYIPVWQVTDDKGLNSYLDIMEKNKLNTAVIDMKDDYGFLRYDTKDPLVLAKGAVSSYAVELDTFVSKMKEKDIYLIARVVVFKDRTLSRYQGGAYAVWDSKTKAPWVGIRSQSEEETEYYDEHWVDPYSEYVWEYNTAIAKELVARGFDEIQFDYIRFPTDGLNLGNASYRFQEPGMTRESALMSFLSYARKNVDAPIGIDIYGANGWYRTGARTGQDVELLARYVDVICPMFYPNHFENSFLAHAPEADRPYRIYFYGNYRNAVIGRNQVLVRAWVQAFYLNVAYDRKYYNSEYVRKELFGVRDSTNSGFMHWNNSGRYDDISPAPGPDEAFIGTTFEAGREFRKPGLSKKTAASAGTETHPGSDYTPVMKHPLGGQ
jgi:hypothetical protein